MDSVTATNWLLVVIAALLLLMLILRLRP